MDITIDRVTSVEADAKNVFGGARYYVELTITDDRGSRDMITLYTEHPVELTNGLEDAARQLRDLVRGQVPDNIVRLPAAE